MGLETTWTSVGAASDRLLDVVEGLRAGDVLRPVTVITPSPQAAVTLRRALARRSGGLTAVGFQSLDSLAEQLAAPDIGPEGIALGVDRELAVAAIRAELALRPGRFAAIAHHRSTWEAVALAVDEVAAVDDSARASIRSSGGLAAEVVRLHDAVAGSVGIGGRVAVLGAASRRVRRQPHVLDEVGPVVVHLPGRLDRPSLGLLAAIGERSPVVVLAGTVGDARADASAVSTVVALGGRPPRDDEVGPQPVPTRVLTANDVDDEVRAAVRAALVEAESGVPFHDMALVHPAGAPYTRAVAEVLRASGVPFSGPSTDTLGHTAPGRVLLGLLDVAARGWAREALIDLWSTGVVVGPSGGPVPAVLVDERTRRLGVVAGRSAWRDRLAGRRRWLDEHPVAPLPGDEDAERHAAARAAEIAELDLVDELLATVEALLDDLPRDWGGVGSWAGRVLDTLCGPLTRRGGWPVHDLDADTAARTALGRLADLERVDPVPTADVVADTVRATLDAPAPRRDATGTGLLVTTLDHPPAVPLHTVIVVGLAEGHVPRLGRDDVLVGEAARRTAGLPVATDATVDQHRALLTAMGAARTTRLLTYARRDQRSGRTQVPSRWLVDAVERSTGQRPRTAALIAGADVPGVEVVPSHHAALAAVVGGASTPLHGGERRLAALTVADDFDAHPAAAEPVVAAGATLARSRAADAFTRFDGNVGEGIDVLDGRHLSPTSLETYATCPRRWFFEKALRVGDVDRPEEVERLDPRNKGSLAHLILERFVGEAIAEGRVPAPGEPWGPDSELRLVEIATEELDDFEQRGELTGHARWWQHDRHEIVTVLLTTIRDDDDVRASTSSTPVAVELTFGRDGVPPLEVTLDDGRVVLLAGQADRVDEVPGGVMVHDYKFSGTSQFKGLDRAIEDGGDPLAGGQKLQLLTYAEAAAQQRGVDRSSAWYWFLKPGSTGTRIGYEIGPEHRRLYRRTLGVLVDGIGAGQYPSRSGAHNWFWGTNENCGWCEFDAICPADREEEWGRVRADPSLADVVLLVEEGAPAFLLTSPVDGEAAP